MSGTLPMWSNMFWCTLPLSCQALGGSSRLGPAKSCMDQTCDKVQVHYKNDWIDQRTGVRPVAIVVLAIPIGTISIRRLGGPLEEVPSARRRPKAVGAYKLCGDHFMAQISSEGSATRCEHPRQPRCRQLFPQGAHAAGRWFGTAKDRGNNLGTVILPWPDY